jgi:hypothetical protein
MLSLPRLRVETGSRLVRERQLRPPTTGDSAADARQPSAAGHPCQDRMNLVGERWRIGCSVGGGGCSLG